MGFFQQLILLALAFVSVPLQAASLVQAEMSFGWETILPVFVIIALLIIIIVLGYYVKQQQRNHVQLMVWMYGSILDGRLRNLIINLQDSMEFLCVDVEKNELDSFSLDGFWRLGETELQMDLLDLAEKCALGIKGARNLRGGFEYLNGAIQLMNSLPIKTVDVVWLLKRSERQQLETLLLESIHLFEAVKYQIDV